MNVTDAMNAIRGYYHDNVATPYSLETIHDNEEHETPDNSVATWARFTVQTGTSFKVSTGKNARYRMPGIATIQIYGEIGKGTATIDTLVDAIVTLFRSVTVATHISFRTPERRQIGSSGDRWQINVICPFYVDDLAT